MFKFGNMRYLISIFVWLMFHTILLLGVSHHTFIHRCAFQEYADFVFDTTNDQFSAKPGGSTFSPEQMKHGSVIFIRTASLPAFFRDMRPRIKHRYILITAIDSYSVPMPLPSAPFVLGPVSFPTEGFIDWLKDPLLVAWFGIHSNMTTFHPKFIPIPLGPLRFNPIYDDREALNPFFTNLREHTRKDKLLYMNFSIDTNSERIGVKNLFMSKPFCYNAQRKDFKPYLEEMAHFKFTLSPPGNGPDCFRTWEALLVGSIPIVKSSALNVLYKDLPVLIINRWKGITESFLNLKYQELSSRKYRLDKLYMGYWLKRIDAKKHLARVSQSLEERFL
jgi:hypothetical protein